LGILPQDAATTDEYANWRDIELMRGSRVRFAKPLKLDLGGIAKGFAVDLAVEVLQQLGMDEIYVNAGGDLRVEGKRQRSILLRNPAAPAQAGHRLLLQKDALATSAAYFSRIMHDGIEFSALIDGRTRESYAGDNSVSVRADTCLASDALTKIVLFARPSIAEACLTRFNARAYVLGLAG
jgi:thiamine biosynthesis lipoprotein